MAYSAMQVANAFIQKAQEGKIPNLTPMKLQKLLFFAQSWYLKNNKSRLFNDEFIRWQYGPVVQSVYYEFAKNKGTEIKHKAKNSFGTDFESRLNREDEFFLDELITAYGEYTGWQLSEMTHTQGGAWEKGKLGSIISDLEMYHGRV
ncbi:hypothetical protein AO053_04875 [Haemophilus influenzae biotype aegyptius]|uniref:Antitoxin SocA-like Panacea domain-containing protein n=3 Tax=Haemophilus TaxID=724 RepID=A0A7G2JWQ3_HAEIF|nr:MULTISPECIES: type II toxin-antitoxin system antitoxin SocA domain-containing protein [Haemophilus]EFA27756.1 conserved hypothetical protein [Haemophilus influenzae HK1212]EGF13252.1 hypothetical protein HMPREF9095_1732 [Haemophilus aegyptius ATCC 11116]OBX82757.1 hypothetical protein A9520_02610 [Haemophilus aegyptius]QEQ59095.1 DUF4065 domain-containing protein [Haemophilus influenzae biotype aegyptius]QEQ61193.1 DUF4065 domain-containing protein [Haemophilus influenzae biotype aegyptius]